MDKFVQLYQSSEEGDYDFIDKSQMPIPCDANDTHIDSKLFQVVCKSEPSDNPITEQSNYELNCEVKPDVSNFNFKIGSPKTVQSNVGNCNFGWEDEIGQIKVDEATNEPDELEIELEDGDNQNNKIRKLKRNSGLAYVTKNGKIIKKRKSKQLENCKKRCGEKISKELREKCFNEYWTLGTYSKRLAYASKRIEINKKSRITNLRLPKKQRNFTCKYFVINDSQNKIDVCKRCYMNIYDETHGFISSIIKKNTAGLYLIDFRGHFESAKKITNQQKIDIELHIKSFPVYESYYSRSHTKNLYLAQGLNLTKMYDLYQEKFDTSKVSYTKYREIFISLNLKFTKSQSDTCSKCDRFEVKIKKEQSQDRKDDLISHNNKHHEYAEIAYRTKEIDKADIGKTVLCVDLQQCLPTPYLKSSTSFYKRKLWTFNLTIRNCNDNTTHFFIWDETISGSGPNQGASCIFKYLTNSSSLTSHIVIYSDTSILQNRYSIIATMFQYLMSIDPQFVILEHKFLESGHTHNECDIDHNVIERKQKSCNALISHPYDWAQLIRSCGQKKKFNVCEMRIQDFFDFSQLQIQYFKKSLRNQQKEHIVWNDIRILRYTKGNSASILYKTNYKDATFNTMITRKGGNIHFNLHQLNYDRLPISVEKKNDLLDLLEFIPVVFHNYYHELKTKENMKELCYIEEESDCDENVV